MSSSRINKTIVACIIIILIVNRSTGQDQFSINYGDNKEAGNFKKINGINLYYEIYGT